MNFNIALVKGDGIGPEIVGSAVRVLDELASKYGHNHAETIVGVGIACVSVEIEHTGIRRVVVIAATIEERPL